MAFTFTLTPFDLQRNRELKFAFSEKTKFIFGGMYLAIQTYTLRSPRFNVFSRNWLTKKDKGQDTTTKRETKHNSDGSTERIETITQILDNGMKIVTTVNELSYPTPVQTEESIRENIPVAISSPIGGDPYRHEMDLPRVITRKTTKIVTPPKSVVEFVTETTEEFDAPNAGTLEGNITLPDGSTAKKTFERKYVNQLKPHQKPKPIEVVSMTGKVFSQVIGSPPPQGIDTFYWNQEMGESPGMDFTFGN